jgi:hypothetical protein
MSCDNSTSSPGQSIVLTEGEFENLTDAGDACSSEWRERKRIQLVVTDFRNDPIYIQVYRRKLGKRLFKFADQLIVSEGL